MYGLIYKAVNINNGNFYIGKTVNLEKRIIAHKSFARLNYYKYSYFYAAINKYGFDSFEFIIIDEAENKEELNDKEIFWINELKPVYNIASGGTGGDTLSNHPNKKDIYKNRTYTPRTKTIYEYMVEKYGQKDGDIRYKNMLQKRGEAISKTKTGTKYSQLHREAVSRALTGRKLPKEVIDKRLKTIWNKILEKYENDILELYSQGKSIRQIHKITKCSRKVISKILKHNNIIPDKVNQYG